MRDNTIREIASSIKKTADVIQGLSVSRLDNFGRKILEILRKGNKILICGNGGSAADAQHIAGELQVKLRVMRKPLPALAITVDTSVITAAGNDLGFEYVFSRQVEALAEKGDLLWVFSTSGNSANIVEALKKARELELETAGFLGGDGGAALSYCDLALVVDSSETQKIQEAHITAAHIVCELVEKYYSKVDKQG
jgi:D-sedoheptulose 7-phosphate isomerase